MKTAGAATGTKAGARAIHSIATLLGVDGAFRTAGLSPAQAATVSHARPLPIKGLVSARRSNAATSTAVIGLILVFIMLTQYNTWTLMGVMEEKASRVVEVLLATIRPIQLLAGKVLGIGLLALVQAGLVVGVALVVADVVGSNLLALTSVQSTTPSLLVTVLAYLPPTAPFGMPVLVADGRATWWQFAIAVVISLAATVAVARLAAAGRHPLRGGQATATAATNFWSVSLASPKRSTVLSSKSRALSIPANPGRIERLRKTMCCAWSAWMMGMP